MQKRIRQLLNDIDHAFVFNNYEWEEWSGEFNRHLRKLMLIDSDEKGIKYKFVFGYWQIKNKMMPLSLDDKKEIIELEMEADILRKEALR